MTRSVRVGWLVGTGWSVIISLLLVFNMYIIKVIFTQCYIDSQWTAEVNIPTKQPLSKLSIHPSVRSNGCSTQYVRFLGALV